MILKILFLQLDELILAYRNQESPVQKFLVVVWEAVFGALAIHRRPKLKLASQKPAC